MPHRVPVVLNRFQNSENSRVDRFADAANANARPTRNAMFWPFTRMPPRMETAPITNAVVRATLTTDSESASPRRSTLAKMSCAKEVERSEERRVGGEGTRRQA